MRPGMMGVARGARGRRAGCFVFPGFVSAAEFPARSRHFAGDLFSGGFGVGAFGVRRPLRFLAYKLKLDEDVGLSLDVRKLQDYLRTLGYFAGSPTGWYTPDTQSAVLQFQSEHGIAATGVADAKTKLRLYALAPPEGIPRLKK